MARDTESRHREIQGVEICSRVSTQVLLPLGNVSAGAHLSSRLSKITSGPPPLCPLPTALPGVTAQPPPRPHGTSSPLKRAAALCAQSQPPAPRLPARSGATSRCHFVAREARAPHPASAEAAPAPPSLPAPRPAARGGCERGTAPPPCPRPPSARRHPTKSLSSRLPRAIPPRPPPALHLPAAPGGRTAPWPPRGLLGEPRAGRAPTAGREGERVAGGEPLSPRSGRHGLP